AARVGLAAVAVRPGAVRAADRHSSLGISFLAGGGKNWPMAPMRLARGGAIHGRGRCPPPATRTRTIFTRILVGVAAGRFDVVVPADWAGCPRRRFSTRGGVMKGRSVLLIVGLVIAGAVLASAPATARPIDKGHFNDVFTSDVYDC